MSNFDPEKWALSMMRALKQYTLTGFSTASWELVMEFPNPGNLAKRLPLAKPLIHIEMEDPRSIPFGMGENWVNAIFDEVETKVEYWEAHRHEVDWDVGIWTSAESGGTTTRAEARDILDDLFNGPVARDACMANTDGVEVLSITGGRNFVDVINDLPVYRMVDIVLSTRVFSRKKLPEQTFIETHDQETQVEIDGIVILG